MFGCLEYFVLLLLAVLGMELRDSHLLGLNDFYSTTYNGKITKMPPK
jgi:hypothetical protein